MRRNFLHLLLRPAIFFTMAIYPVHDARSSPADLGLLPRPMQLELREGTWTLGRTTRIIASGPATNEALLLSDALAAPLNIRLPVLPGPARDGDIVMTLEPARADLGAEGYELEVSPETVRLLAHEPAGLFYAGQTLRQLLPAAAWRKAPVEPPPWSVPCVRITDRPRFGWRGLLLDPARHVIPKAALLQMIDAMALHKLNRLQLHLTDDQGWRIEIRSFPKLTARSAWRDGTLIGRLREPPEKISTVPHGGYYSQADLREVVAFAAARHITVVPEIEMPGHSRAWLAAYPEFAVFPDRAATLGPLTTWGISKEVLAPRPKTIEACKRILDEVCEIFPGPFIHIGGDEAPRDQWRQSPEIQQLIRGLGLRNEDELQAWFTAELSHFLAAKGRRLVGWDEILAGARLGGDREKTTLASNAVVTSWRGERGGEAATRAGHDAIMAPYTWTYLDYYQGPPGEEPIAIGGATSLARTYAYEPVPANLPVEAARRILGAQTQVWSEYLPSPDAVVYMTFPRACALAEVFWSPREGKELTDFLARLERHENRLRALGLPYRPLARRTVLPGAGGRIVADPKDAVILGCEVLRQPDGSLANWKDPLTMFCWRIDFPGSGNRRLRLLLGPAKASPQTWLEAIISGQALRSSLAADTDTLELGIVKVNRAGPHLLFLRGGNPPSSGFPLIRGIEIAE